MSDDEAVVLIVCFLAGGRFAWRWGRLVSAVGRAQRPATHLLLAPFLGLAGVLATLLTAASGDVRESPAYVFFYLVMGAAWLAVLTETMPLLGLQPRDDVLDRGNTGAGWVTAAALLGGLAAFAGGNVGDGPGWWCVLFAAGLATVAWLGGWAVLELLAHPTEHVTVDRDPAAALRLAGFLLASGLVAGRGAAGDWVSPLRTVVEFGAAWPIVPLVLLAAAVERRFAPTPERPVGEPRQGAVVGVVYVVLGVLAVLALGPPVGA